MAESKPSKSYEREYARIPVKFAARVRQLEPEQADELRDILRLHPSVWAPLNESGLRELAVSGAGSSEALLAQSILEVTTQLVKLQTRVFGHDGPMVAVDVAQLSGGGGQLLTPLPLKRGDILEMVFEDPVEDVPPVRSLIEIKHRYDDPPGCYGFAYDTIHAHDHDLMIRLIYQLQRRAIRESQRD